MSNASTEHLPKRTSTQPPIVPARPSPPAQWDDHVSTSPGRADDLIDGPIHLSRFREHTAVRNGQAKDADAAPGRFFDEGWDLQMRQLVIFQ
jgi:hypothetical protein